MLSVKSGGGKGLEGEMGIKERMCDENQTARDIYPTKVKQNKTRILTIKLNV